MSLRCRHNFLWACVSGPPLWIIYASLEICKIVKLYSSICRMTAIENDDHSVSPQQTPVAIRFTRAFLYKSDHLIFLLAIDLLQHLQLFVFPPKIIILLWSLLTCICLTQSCRGKELNNYFMSAILKAVQRLFRLFIKVIGNLARQELPVLVMQ